MKLCKQIRTFQVKKITIHKNRQVCPFEPLTHNLLTGNSALQPFGHLVQWFREVMFLRNSEYVLVM